MKCRFMMTVTILRKMNQVGRNIAQSGGNPDRNIPRYRPMSPLLGPKALNLVHDLSLGWHTCAHSATEFVRICCRSFCYPVPSLDMCAASLVIHVLSLTILFFVSPINAFGFTSYPNVFFAPNHVLNNTWFSNSFWAAETAEYWAKTLMETGPWCG